MEKVKVIHIITSSDVGGAQKHVEDIVTNLDPTTFLPIVICGVGGDFDLRLNEKGIKTYKITTFDKKIDFLKDTKTVLELTKIIRKEKPAIIHTHSSKAGILGRLAAFVTGVPVIIFTAHGFVFHEYMSSFKYQFYLHLEKIAGLITDKIIAVSNKDKEKALNNRVISKDKLVTIHNGIDVNYYCPAKAQTEFEKINRLKKSFGINEKDIVIGLLGRLVEEKGIPFFIKAANEIQHRYDNVKFLAVGEGPLQVELETLVYQEGLKDFFIFTGLRTDVIEMLSIIDIVVFSSIKEGLPLALLEALAMEKAVVATTVGGIPEVITSGQNGILVIPKDAKKLAKGIEKFLNNSLFRKEAGQKGRQTVVKAFSLQKMVKETKKIYLELLQAKNIL